MAVHLSWEEARNTSVNPSVNAVNASDVITEVAVASGQSWGSLSGDKLAVVLLQSVRVMMSHCCMCTNCAG
jgi:hypothetical protein